MKTKNEKKKKKKKSFYDTNYNYNYNIENVSKSGYTLKSHNLYAYLKLSR